MRQQYDEGENQMKKFTTLAFAALIALTLSMPVWAQSTTGANNQAKTAAKKDAKEDKKEAAKAKKQASKDKKKADKQAKKSSTK
jgi:hypothetical protein